MATLYFASTNTAADPTISGTFKYDSNAVSTTVSNTDTLIFDSRGTGNLAPAAVANLAQTNTIVNNIIADQSFVGQWGDGTNYWSIGARNIYIGQQSGQGTPSGSTRLMWKNPSFTATNANHTTTTATITYNSAAIVTGDSVTISGAADAPYNGDFTVTAINTTTFTYTMLSDPSANTSGAVFSLRPNISVYNSSTTSADTYYPPIQLTGNGLVINETGGNIGISCRPSDTSTLTLNMVRGGNQQPSAYLGSGVTPTAITVNNGNVIDRSNQTAVSYVVSGSQSNVEKFGSGATTTLSIGKDSTFYHSGSGNVTTANVEGKFYRTRDTRSITVSTLNCYGGAEIYLDNGKANSTTRSTTNLIQCGSQDIKTSTPIGERF